MPDKEPPYLRTHTTDVRRSSDRVVLGISAAAVFCFGSILNVTKHAVPVIDTEDKDHSLHVISQENNLKKMTKEQALCELERLVHHCAMHCDFQSATLLSNALTSEKPTAELIDMAVKNMNSAEARSAFIQLAAVLEQHPDLGQQVVPSLHRYFAKQPLMSPVQLIRPLVNQQRWCCDPRFVELVTGKFLERRMVRHKNNPWSLSFSNEERKSE